MTIPFPEFTTCRHYGYFYWFIIPTENGVDLIQYAEKFFQPWKVSEKAKLEQKHWLVENAKEIPMLEGLYVYDLMLSWAESLRPKVPDKVPDKEPST